MIEMTDVKCESHSRPNIQTIPTNVGIEKLLGWRGISAVKDNTFLSPARIVKIGKSQTAGHENQILIEFKFIAKLY